MRDISHIKQKRKLVVGNIEGKEPIRKCDLCEKISKMGLKV
jgi:hypothetical protein